jgi:hypothetical protein
MNNTTTKNLALAAIVVAAVLIVVGGTFVALQPANAIDEIYSHSTSTICINDTPCVTKICINNEPCHNAVTSNPTNTGHHSINPSTTKTKTSHSNNDKSNDGGGVIDSEFGHSDPLSDALDAISDNLDHQFE